MPKFTNVFDELEYEIRGDPKECAIVARRGSDRFETRVTRAECDGGSPALTALVRLAKWVEAKRSETSGRSTGCVTAR
jgi:hypothetical protein